MRVALGRGEVFQSCSAVWEVLEDVSTRPPVLLLLRLPVAASIFVDHFAPIVGVWYQLKPVRFNWVNSPPLLNRNLCLLLPHPPHCSLLLLQPHLLLVRLVPPALLHQPLVRSQPGVSWSKVFLHLIQLTCESAEVVVLLSSLVIALHFPEQFRCANL